MRRYLRSIAMLLLSCASSLVCSAELVSVKPEEVGMSSEKLLLVDEVINDFIRNRRLAGSIVMIARHGKIAHFKAYGHMDIESNKLMGKDTIMAIASMTKAITSVAALILYEEGKLDLDAPVSSYLSEFKNLKIMRNERFFSPKREPTIRDLMRHTSGWGDGKSGNVQIDKLYREAMATWLPTDSFDQRVKKISRLPLAFEPGTDWVYSISTEVLGLVIEKVSKQPLSHLFQEKIFNPLGMSDTACYISEEKIGRLAIIYQPDGEGGLKAMNSDFLKNQPALCSGGGGLVSTISDYMRFLMMVANDGSLHGVQIITKKSVDLMRYNQLPKEAGWVSFRDWQGGTGFGLGFAVREELNNLDPASRLGEYGWHGIYSTHYWLSSKDDLIVITFEQLLPFSEMVLHGVRGLIYEAIVE